MYREYYQDSPLEREIPPPQKVNRYPDIPRLSTVITCSVLTVVMICIAICGGIILIYAP